MGTESASVGKGENVEMSREVDMAVGGGEDEVGNEVRAASAEY